MWACLFQKATKPKKAAAATTTTTKPSALRATGTEETWTLRAAGMEELADAYVFRAHMDPKVRAADIGVFVRTHGDGTRTLIICSGDRASRRHSRVRVSCKYLLPDDADARSTTRSLPAAIYACGVVAVTVPKL